MAEKLAAKKRAAMLSPSIKKNRHAAGWRGLSVDLITNPDDHPVFSSKENEDQEDDNHVGPDERVDGMTVKYIWGASKLEKGKLRAIWCVTHGWNSCHSLLTLCQGLNVIRQPVDL